MFCKKCGNQNSDDAIVCTNCGVPTDNYEKKDVSDGLLIAGYILALLIPIVGMIIGVIVMVKGRVGHGIAMIFIALFIACLGFACLMEEAMHF